MITPRKLEACKRTALELRQAYERGERFVGNPGWLARVVAGLCKEVEKLQTFKRRAQKREKKRTSSVAS